MVSALKPNYDGPLSRFALKSNLRCYIKGMMVGNGANCIRIIPNSACKFMAYEYLEGGVLGRAFQWFPFQLNLSCSVPETTI